MCGGGEEWGGGRGRWRYISGERKFQYRVLGRLPELGMESVCPWYSISRTDGGLHHSRHTDLRTDEKKNPFV